MSYLVLDIETIADTSVWTPPPPPVQEEPSACTCTPPPTGDAKHKRGCPSQKKVKPAKAPEDVFAPLYAHKPVVIGLVWLDDNLMLQPNGIGVFGASAYGDERALLAAWSAFMQQQAGTTIVTYAGRGFDLPVLTLRALQCGVPMAWYDKRYRQRYDSEHIDLFDQLTEFGSIPRAGFSLDTMSRLLGLPEKGEVNGSNVGKLWAAGERQKIEAYCVSDCVKTTFLLMRYLLMRGRVGIEQYRAAAGALLNTINTMMGPNSGLFGVDPKRLLLEETLPF